MKPLRVAMLTPWMVKCGISAYSHYLTHALAQEGCEVAVVRLSRFGVRDENYLRHYAEEVPSTVDLVHVQNEYSFFNWQDQIFYFALKDRLAFLGKNIPVVTTMHATGNFRMDKIIRAYSDAVIVHNRWQQNQFNLPCTVIPMGVQKVSEPVDSGLAKKRWAVKGKTVGFFGFVSEYKGLETLIDAVSQLSDVTLLVGGGWYIDIKTPYMNNIRNYAAQKIPGRIRWLGYLEDEDLPYFFGACDIMVYGHAFISESMSLLTALAYEKAVLASNQPAFREKEASNTVLTFKNASDLSGKINALVSEPDLRTRLERNAKAYALKNSWSESAKKHLKLYNKILNNCVGGED